MSPQFFSGNQTHRSIKPVALTMLFENFSTNSLNFYAILFYVIYKLEVNALTHNKTEEWTLMLPT